MLLEGLLFVLAAGIFTAIVCGFGTLPFFFVDEISDRVTVALWGLAGGIMLFASLFGFIFEGLRDGTVFEVGAGLVVGVVVVVVADRIITGYEFEPRDIPDADFRKLVLIVGVLTVHSFPEGVALGVAFADLGIEGDLVLAGLAIPGLAIFITAAISIQNIPEGLAVAIPLHTYGIANWKIFGWAVFSSIPQPIGAGIAYVFVTTAREFLPFGFGFASGAMIFLVLHDIFPEGLDHGSDLPGHGRRELLVGIAVGVAIMLPVMLLTE
ncbi:GufA family transport protein (probable substrate zinc) [Natronomonas pharaonis DSM 2160]|uniref:GufA family transport protein (Probable substrate zinc) n=1 Tax=Natronomonas pharaonis (strain ATCC 35678 / DSM 2160 / CIP 103997 / JCM 8858 / NBRC 14720 / NCIMB 2260 / Gabara) TaxID=348780 RepID=A0A1U7EYI0_NATPD|nr:ZIP family metal transporter [Natronomonas pharaonis]CAI50292.1 GufA family transport protein (probable substrate zinc) [Natronomonas pharaonis DSM 2160]